MMPPIAARAPYPTYGSPVPAPPGPAAPVMSYQGSAVAPGMGYAPVAQGPSFLPPMQPEAAMATARAPMMMMPQQGGAGGAYAQSYAPVMQGAPVPQPGPCMQSASYMPQMGGPGMQGLVHAPRRVEAHYQPFPPGSRVRLKGVAENSPFAGRVLVVASEPDVSGQVRVQLEDGGGPSTALLLGPQLLESADVAPPPQAPVVAASPAAWLEGGAAVGQSGLKVGDQVRFRGQTANKQYEGKVLTVEAADVGDGSGRVRVVVQHETHVSRLAIDPNHLELVADGGQVVYGTMPSAGLMGGAY